MAHKPSPRAMKDFMASHTALLRIGSYQQLVEKAASNKNQGEQGLEMPSYTINAVTDDRIAFSCYLVVDALPLEPEEGVLYIYNDSPYYWDEENLQWVPLIAGEHGIMKVKDQYGNELPIDETDYSVTLPQEDLSDGFYYTTEILNTDIADTQNIPISSIASFDKDDLVLNETTVYDANGTIAVVTALVNQSTVQVKVMTTAGAASGTKMLRIADGYPLSDTIDDTTTIAVTNISGWVYNDAKLGISLFYDEDGRIGVLSAKTTQNATIKTVTSRFHTGGTYYTTDVINNGRNASTTISWSDIADTFDADHLVVNETLFYDQYGGLARLTAVDETNQTVTIQTIMHIDWSGNSFHHTRLSGSVGESIDVSITDLDAYDADLCIPYRTFIYDNYGTFAIATAKTASKVTITILTTPAGQDVPSVLYYYDALTPTVGAGQGGISVNRIDEWDDAWFSYIQDSPYYFTLYDDYGTLALIKSANATARTVSVETISTSSDAIVWRYTGSDTYAAKIDSYYSGISYSTICKHTSGSTYITGNDIKNGGTLVTDSYGNIMLVTGHNDTSSTLTLKVLSTGPASSAVYTSGTLSTVINGTTTLNTSTVSSYSSAKIDQTFVYDSQGTVAKITSENTSNSTFTATTVTIAGGLELETSTKDSYLLDDLDSTKTIKKEYIFVKGTTTTVADNQIIPYRTKISDKWGRTALITATDSTTVTCQTINIEAPLLYTDTVVSSSPRYGTIYSIGDHTTLYDVNGTGYDHYQYPWCVHPGKQLVADTTTGCLYMVLSWNSGGMVYVKLVSIGDVSSGLDPQKPNTWTAGVVNDFGDGLYGIRFTGSKTFTSSDLDSQNRFVGVVETFTPTSGSFGAAKTIAWGGCIQILINNYPYERGLVFGPDYGRAGNNLATETAGITFRTGSTDGYGNYQLWYNGNGYYSAGSTYNTLKYDIWVTFYKGSM